MTLNPNKETGILISGYDTALLYYLGDNDMFIYLFVD